jgi:hypothetical protein
MTDTQREVCRAKIRGLVNDCLESDDGTQVEVLMPNDLHGFDDVIDFLKLCNDAELPEGVEFDWNEWAQFAWTRKFTQAEWDALDEAERNDRAFDEREAQRNIGFRE